MARLLKTLWWLAAGLGVVGCTGLLERDFEKAMLVSNVELGNSKIYARKVVPPTGIARLIFVLPNYRCSPPPDGPVSFRVTADNRDLWSGRKRLSELTWSYGEGSCDAYGYLAGNDGLFRLEQAQQAVTFELDVSAIEGGAKRPASVWLIYGDRVPTARIFGEKK